MVGSYCMPLVKLNFKRASTIMTSWYDSFKTVTCIIMYVGKLCTASKSHTHFLVVFEDAYKHY